MPADTSNGMDLGMNASALRQARKIATPVHRWSRGRKANFALQFIESRQIQSVLVIGAHASEGGRVNNVIESVLLAKVARFVATGLEEDGGGEWPEYICANGLDLPFPDNSFDLVYSNAVIEHVGDMHAQAQFIREHARVGKHWISTTPNRLFPVEAHRYTLFTHWSDNWYGTAPSVTRLLTPRDLKDLLPDKGRVHGGIASMTLTATSD